MLFLSLVVVTAGALSGVGIHYVIGLRKKCRNLAEQIAKQKTELTELKADKVKNETAQAELTIVKAQLTNEKNRNKLADQQRLGGSEGPAIASTGRSSGPGAGAGASGPGAGQSQPRSEEWRRISSEQGLVLDRIRQTQVDIERCQSDLDKTINNWAEKIVERSAELDQKQKEAREASAKAEEDLRTATQEREKSEAAERNSKAAETQAAAAQQDADRKVQDALAAKAIADRQREAAMELQAQAATEREAALQAKQDGERALMAASEKEKAASQRHQEAATREDRAIRLESLASEEQQAALGAKRAAELADADAQRKLDAVNSLREKFRPAVMRREGMSHFCLMIEENAGADADAAMLLAQLYTLAASEKDGDADPRFRLAAVKESSRFLLRFLDDKGKPLTEIMETLSFWAEQFNAAAGGRYSVQIPKIGGGVDRGYMSPAKQIDTVSKLLTWAVRNDKGIAEYKAEVE